MRQYNTLLKAAAVGAFLIALGTAVLHAQRPSFDDRWSPAWELMSAPMKDFGRSQRLLLRNHANSTCSWVIHCVVV